MSNQSNTELLELATFHIDYWEGTIMAKLLEWDIEQNDLEALSAHIKESTQLMFEREYHPDEDAPQINNGFNLDARSVY